MDIDGNKRQHDDRGYSEGGGRPDAGDKKKGDNDRSKGSSHNAGNPYPGYRGPTGTRNPRARPEPAPENARFNPHDKPRPSIWDRVFQPRRTRNPTPSYKATMHNLSVLAGLTPGPAMPAKIAGMMMGIGPQFKDYTGMVSGPGDWDSTNRAGQWTIGPNGKLVRS